MQIIEPHPNLLNQKLCVLTTDQMILVHVEIGEPPVQS